MTYELAKQLKDAGWKGLDYPWFAEANKLGLRKFLGDAPSPTLSELIEACAHRNTAGVLDTYFTLSFFRDKWSANMPNAFSKQDLLEGFRGEGQIAEEAVARLWLTLNPQK